ncbi:MAG: hypothetical protein ACXVCP_18900 [Bdellovibrio sp.]
MNRKFNVGILIVLLVSFVAGGVYWKFKHSSSTKIVRYDYFNLEGLLEEDLGNKNFNKVQSVLDNVGPHVKTSQSLIDQYIFEYYSMRIQIDSMNSEITDLNQYYYRMKMVTRRLEEIKSLMYKEKADLAFRKHWADKIDGLLAKAQQKENEFAGYMKTVRTPAQKTQ